MLNIGFRNPNYQESLLVKGKINITVRILSCREMDITRFLLDDVKQGLAFVYKAEHYFPIPGK